METTLNQRIKEIFKTFNITMNGFAKGDSALQARLSRQLNQGAAITVQTISSIIEEFPTVSLDWLFKGEGSMLKDTVVIPLSESRTAEKIEPISTIPLYNVDASAGLNKLFAEGGELIGKISVPNMPKCEGAVHVVGDSMYPLLKSGDIIAYEVINDLRWFIPGEIYLIQLNFNGDISIVVKYVQPVEGHKDVIKLVSYNKEHAPMDIPINAIQAIARVKFCVRKMSMM